MVGEEIQGLRCGRDVRHIGERLLRRGTAAVVPVGGDGVVVGARAAYIIREVGTRGGAEGGAVPGDGVVGHRLDIVHNADYTVCKAGAVFTPVYTSIIDVPLYAAFRRSIVNAYWDGGSVHCGLHIDAEPELLRNIYLDGRVKRNRIPCVGG